MTLVTYGGINSSVQGVTKCNQTSSSGTGGNSPKLDDKSCVVILKFDLAKVILTHFSDLHIYILFKQIWSWSPQNEGQQPDILTCDRK